MVEESLPMMSADMPGMGTPEPTMVIPRSPIMDEIVWGVEYFELKGTYKVLMLDHMPGGTVGYSKEVPAATVAFQMTEKGLEGIYREPEKEEPAILTDIYCDGRKCGWIHSQMGRNSDEVFKFELDMYHGNILVGGCGTEKGASPVACIQISEEVLN